MITEASAMIWDIIEVNIPPFHLFAARQNQAPNDRAINTMINQIIFILPAKTII
jgi:hypothetical protein